MTWLIIALILLAAFGPVLWLVPSRRDRQLSALREQARREGLVVDLRRVPKLDPSADERVTAGGRVKQPTIECAAYARTLRRRLILLPAWRLLRGDGPPQVRRGWQFDPALKAAGPEFQASMQRLDDLFEALPEDVIGVELSPRALILYWLESRTAEPETVTRLSDMLTHAQQELLALDEQLQRACGDDDS